MPNIHYDPLDSLVFLTNRIGRLLGNRIRKRISETQACEEVAVHPQCIGLLVDLWMKDGVRQQDLAVSVIKDKGTIARSLDAMERMDLVVRVPDPQDKRNKRIYLTRKGREMKGKLIPHTDAVMEEASQGIKEEDLVICKRVLGQMYNSLIAEAAGE